MIFVNFTFFQFFFTCFAQRIDQLPACVTCACLVTLLLERNDNKSDEDVDEEERKHNEEDDVEQRELDPEVRQWAVILVRGVHRPLQDAIRVAISQVVVSNRVREHSRWPAFTGLHSEQRENGGPNVVVIKLAPTPDPPRNFGRRVFGRKQEELALTPLHARLT